MGERREEAGWLEVEGMNCGSRPPRPLFYWLSEVGADLLGGGERDARFVISVGKGESWELKHLNLSQT